MIGAIEFMKRWKDTCESHPSSCDLCHLKDHCWGSMAVLKEKDIIALIGMVMGGAAYGKSTVHKANDS